jgi:hypothetical protein
VRSKIEGVFLDLASVFGSTNGDAPPTVLYGVAELWNLPFLLEAAA